MTKTIRRALATAVLALAGSSSGCMSAGCTFLDPVPYAGTQAYGQNISKAVETRDGSSIKMTLDLPATAALDTALLPITIPCALCKNEIVWRRPTFPGYSSPACR
jgi:uncharacterized protein YceK